MDKKLTISRRDFLIGSTSVSSLFAFPIQSLSQTPTPTPSPTPDIPNIPNAPTLDGDDIKARTSTLLSIKWDPVINADSYGIEYVWSTGREELNSITSAQKFKGLAPNRTYRIRIRAINVSGISKWSGAFISATRPPTPPPPSQETITMVDLPETIDLKWDLKDFVKDIDENSNITVVLGREESNQVITLNTGLGIIDKFKVEKKYFNSSFRIALSCEKQNVPSLPSGKNTSFWSNTFVPSSMVFANLRLPQLAETRNISIARMRNYYG